MAINYCVKERQKHNKVQALRDFCETDRKASETMFLERRAEHRRMQRKIHEDRQDTEMENRLLMAKEAEMMRRKQLDQEEHLAYQMKNIKDEDLNQMKLRQRLRRDCVELRDLEAKLKAAYGAKDLVAQVAQRRADEAMEKAMERQSYEVLRLQWEEEKECMKKKKDEEDRQKTEYRHELQDQLLAEEKARQKAYYDFLQEKHLIDAVTAKILEEDCKNEEEKLRKRARAKEEIENFIKLRDEERAKRQKIIDEENRKFEEYLQQRALQDDEVRRLQMERNAKKEELKHRMGTQLYEIEMNKMEHEKMLIELHEAQTRYANEARHRKALEEKIRHRLYLGEIAKLQLADKTRKIMDDREEERQWKEAMLQKFAEDDRIEQLTAQARWQKQQEHRRAVQQMLEDRRAAHAEEMQRRLKEYEIEQNYEAARKHMVEEERLRMLREHAVCLLGYLPRGILRDSDLPHLGCDLSGKMKQMNM